MKSKKLNNMIAQASPTRRNRIKPVPNINRNSIRYFQKVHKAVVLFHTCKMSKYSAHNLIKCEMINSVGVKTHAYGKSHQDAFNNMKKMYNQKLQS